MNNAGENVYIEQAIRSDPVLCEMGLQLNIQPRILHNKMERLNKRFLCYSAEHVHHVTELNYLPHYERNYSVRPSKTRFRRMLFCIHKDKMRELCIMLFSEKMHLMQKTYTRLKKQEFVIFQVWDIIGRATKEEQGYT